MTLLNQRYSDGCYEVINPFIWYWYTNCYVCSSHYKAFLR